MKDLEKRARIMSRSMKLGHCICDPAKPCPCDIFKSKDVCLCAGERLEERAEKVRLTKLVEKAGCASKIDQGFLKRVLKNLPPVTDPKVLVGIPAGDDAGVYDLGNGDALVQTVDVFTPCADDPYIFGQIAAANSLSDIYAMGGRPITALSIVGFPVGAVADSVMAEILAGGIDKMNEAETSVIGGHSINDPQLKAGFAVTGLIGKERVLRNSTARCGDALILTKPLGTGIIAFASQIDRASEESIKAAAVSMTMLNKKACELMVESRAHCCTDITGFGLMGHLCEMACASRVDAEIILDKLPLLPGVADYMVAGIIPGAVERNRSSSEKYVVPEDGLADGALDICFDAQTSGGLLIAISGDKADNLVDELHEEGMAEAAIIGSVTSTGSGWVMVRKSR